MSVLQLRAEVYEKIEGLQTEKGLRLILKAIDKVKGKEDDWWDELSDERKKLLDEAIAESYDPNNWIDHEDAKKKHAKWLSK